MLLPLTSMVSPLRRPLVVPASGGFDPATISGIVAWHAARKEAYANSDPVTTLTDWSGNGLNASAFVTNPTFKTALVNGLPGVNFATNAAMHSLITLTNPFTIILVETASGAGNIRTIDSGSENGLMSFGRTGTNQVYNSGPVYSSSSILGPGIGIFTCGSDARFYFSGVDITTSTGNNSSFGVVGYGDAYGGEHGNTDLLEAIYYSRVLTSSDMNYLGNGLSALYGYAFSNIP